MYILIFIIFIIFIILFFLFINHKKTIIKGEGYINILKIKNIDEIIEKSTFNNKIIDLRKYLPSHIGIKIYKNKGWGIYTKKDIEKDSIIYISPYVFIENPKQIKVISSIGEKYLRHDIVGHSNINNKYPFTFWDNFINHSLSPNSYYKYEEYYNNLRLYCILYAKRNIKKNEELTINYMYLFNIFYFFNLLK